MLTEQQKEENRQRFMRAVENAKRVLKPGDRLRVTKCPGTKRWITFDGWDGHWIVSKSGIADYAASCVDRLNGEPVDSAPWTLFRAHSWAQRHRSACR